MVKWCAVITQSAILLGSTSGIFEDSIIRIFKDIPNLFIHSDNEINNNNIRFAGTPVQKKRSRFT